ncbi:MAG: alpha/beta fold hydrolase [Pseudomonadota bacterium]
MLVEISPSGRPTEKPPLFCVHTLGGNLFHYYELARHLAPDQPVFGLQARGMYGSSNPDVSVESISTAAIAAMREVQPRGPFQIAGYSSGGVVAFEMAQQLRNEGERVTLAILDTYIYPYPYVGNHRALLRSFREADNWRAKQEIIYFWGLSLLRLGRLRKLREVGEAQRWAHWSYVPGVYPGDAHLFYATDNRAQLDDPHLGWDRFIGGDITVHNVPGGHGLMVKAPAVQVLADKLQALLAPSTPN